ncbi:MAG: tetratricopeptide repeat protein [Desulfovibrionaceae bacterium]|nr:tetratricopeptide repeat protein [Desulfovibrionaceae bacterium]
MQNNEQHVDISTAAKGPSIHGVFSSQEIRKVGTGTTTRKSVHKTFWFVEQKGNDIVCQPLNTNYVPSGPKRTITLEELLTKFSPEPEFYQSSVYPRIKQLDNTIKKGDDHLSKGENFSAEHQYQAALKVDCDNVRANFGIGLTYLERGDTSKAQNIFDRLVKLDSAFEEEHKHLFNEFGIQLRKNKMIKQSIAYYERAIVLTQNDENLYMNVARAYLEAQEIPKCVDNLLKALELNPQHLQSFKFLTWLIQKNMVPLDKQPQVNAVLAQTQGGQEAQPQAAPETVEPKASSLPELLDHVGEDS